MIYNPEYHRNWYKKNRERLLEIRKKYNKEYFSRPEVIESEKKRNATPERKAYRKAYKKTEKGKIAERNYVKRSWEKNAPLREKHLLWRYGITPEQYQELLTKQGGKCAICLLESKYKLHVDHCHKSGTVRGLLCGSCNRALGLLKDNTEFLSKAIAYLNEIR